MTNPLGKTLAGDLYLVAEGYKVFPRLPEEVPAKVMSYAAPYSLNGNGIIADPNALASNQTSQILTIQNNGDGKFIAKGMIISLVDPTGAGVTSAILPGLGFQVQDSTSGNKAWVFNGNPTSGPIHCPASIMTYMNGYIPFNTPKYIDPSGTIKVQFVFPSDAASLLALSGAAAWPIMASVTIFGALLPI